MSIEWMLAPWVDWILPAVWRVPVVARTARSPGRPGKAGHPSIQFSDDVQLAFALPIDRQDPGVVEDGVSANSKRLPSGDHTG